MWGQRQNLYDGSSASANFKQGASLLHIKAMILHLLSFFVTTSLSSKFEAILVADKY